MIKVLFKIFILTTIFSFLIFYTKNYFFGGFQELENKYIEENYIEPVSKVDSDLVKEKVLEKLESADKEKVLYSFSPENFSQNLQALTYLELLNNFFYSNYLQTKIDNLNIELNQEEFEVRGRMENKTVKLFGILDIEKPEFLSLSIHEFAHFLDLYILKKTVINDISNYFYDISWEKTKVLKAGMTQGDFVSGYAMTNKYEDFAETFTYYVVHNSDFLKRAESSDILKQKYDFFQNYVFKNSEFNFDYSNKQKIKDYYRDITKIDYDLEEFKKYLNE